jgi:hypothetical protein
MFKREHGNWTEYRARFGLSPADEIDLHFGRRELGVSYDEVMAEVKSIVLQCLRGAQANGRPHFMFIHGWSTSRPGQTTARSVVRGVMRSPAATPYIVRAECIQHHTVFLVKIKPPVENTLRGR